MKSIPLKLSLILVTLLTLLGMTGYLSAQETQPSVDDEVVVRHVTPVEAAELIADNPDYVILDVRTPIEYKHSQIENAININYYSFSFKRQIEKLDRDKTYIVHCQTGVRSGKTLPIMLRAGFNNIIHMDGGMKGWKQAELPTQ